MLDLKELAAGDKRNGASAAARPAGAANAMHVVLHVVRQVIIENDLHVVDIDAARGDIGGDQKFQARLAELVHHPVAHGLGHVAVQPIGGIALRFQMVDQVIDHALGIAENDARAW